MCIKTIEYTCTATCSEECHVDNQNIFKTHYCKKLETYNNCKECRIYVCKECYNELQKNNINYCLICRKTIENPEDIENSEDIELQEIRKNNYIESVEQYCNGLKDSQNQKCENCYEKLEVYVEDCCDSIHNYFEILSDFEKEFRYCHNICFFLGFIFIPLIVSLIFNILFNGFDSVKNIFLSDDNVFILTIMFLSWIYGFMFCIIVFHIYLRCKK